MSGRESHDFSRGRDVNASALSRRFGVSTRAVAKFLEPVEWHHTGKNYKKTNYYDPRMVTPSLLASMKAWDRRPRRRNEVEIWPGFRVRRVTAPASVSGSVWIVLPDMVERGA